MHDVFISYSHKDKYIADGICANLEANSIKCWYAPRDIEPGKEWSESIMNALAKTKVFVLVFSKNSNRSDQVYNEITSAIKYGCHIIPFCVDSVEMEVRLAYYLNAVHWLDATDAALLDSIEKLYEKIYVYLNEKPAEKFVRIPVKAKNKRVRNIAVAAVIILLTVLLAFFVGVFTKDDEAPPLEENSAQVGDIIEFGTLANQPIEWKVIDKEGDRILVVSREGLYSEFYNLNSGICTWESCTLRSELNSRYYDMWFTEEEKENIFETHLDNPGNSVYGTEGGRSTRDKLFILSVDEVLKYFPEQENRKLMSAGYSSETYNCWWVRNPGENRNSALYVDEEGNVGYEIGIDMEMGVGTAAAGMFWVRPAMWIKYDGPAEAETTAAEIKITNAGTEKSDGSSDGLSVAKQGDIVLFGSYEQDNNIQNGKEAIEWVVLEVTEFGGARELTLISKNCLDQVNITSNNYGYNLWYDSVARSWLNGTFYRDAFNFEERGMIRPILVHTVDFSEEPSATVDTSDNVVLLSEEQYKKYSHLPFVSQLLPTEYAYENRWNDTGWWLIDTLYTGDFTDKNLLVTYDGEIYNGMQKFSEYARPVIKVMAETK